VLFLRTKLALHLEYARSLCCDCRRNEWHGHQAQNNVQFNFLPAEADHLCTKSGSFAISALCVGASCPDSGRCSLWLCLFALFWRKCSEGIFESSAQHKLRFSLVCGLITLICKLDCINKSPREFGYYVLDQNARTRSEPIEEIGTPSVWAKEKAPTWGDGMSGNRLINRSPRYPRRDHCL